MRYLNPQERKANPEVTEYLGDYISKTIKFGLASAIVNRHAKKDWKILDAGCASGAFLQELSQGGYKELYGADYEAYFNWKNSAVKNLVTADFNYQNIGYPDNFFDLITAWCVIPHLENPHHFTRDAFRLLKKEGVFILSMPHITAPSNRRFFRKTGEFVHYSEKNDHITFMTPAIFKKTVLKYFTLLEIDYLIKPKVFNGLKGKLRKIALSLWPALKSRWASKIVYVLKK